MENILGRINDFFNNPEWRARFLQYRWPLSLVGLVILLRLMYKEYFWHGLGISGLGEALQLWCFASLHKKKALAAKGPYAVVRNPMYIGRYFLILGAVTMTGRFWLMLIFSVVYYFYMVNRVRREEEILSEIFGAEYAAYCRETNRFLPPMRKPNPKDLRYFRWDLFFKNNAHLNLLAVAVAYLIVYIYLF